MHRFHRIAASIALTLSVTGPAFANDVVTSFEFFDSTGSFTLGSAPETVTFQGGVAASVGIPGLYTSGMNAWMISAGTTGTVSFGTPAHSLDLFFRDQLATNASVLTILDPSNQPLATINGSTTFQHVTVTDTSLGSPIGGLTLQNNGVTGVSVIDDFTYCAQMTGPIADPIPGPIPQSTTVIRLVPVATGLVAPNWGTTAPVPVVSNPSPGDLLFVTDQEGILYAINPASGSKIAFLNVQNQLVSLGVAGPGTFDERGLLGVAFHPNYASNGLLYTYTSEPLSGAADFSTMPTGIPANHQAVITEWKVSNPTAMPNPLDPTTLVDPNSERELVRIDEPQFNHDGGAVSFGGDGMLYISLGDGGAADDQGEGHVAGGNGQDASNVLGTILRIDPLGSSSANGQYGIPAGNPFVADPAVLDEIFAYGFRNPFRFSFDLGTTANPGTGDLIVADVGQNDIEEIAVVQAGDNHGWPWQGASFFDNNGAGSGFVTATAPHAVPAGLIDPIAEYDHDEGTAIIGGFVYRGSRVSQLSGRYVFGDFALTFSADGRLFHLDSNGDIVEFQIAGQTGLNIALLGFGQDADGELYVLGNLTGTPFPDSLGKPTGVVLRIAPASGFINLGLGKAGGTGAVPSFQGSGQLTSGSANNITLTDAAPNSMAVLVAGTTDLLAPFSGGTLVPTPNVVLFGVNTDAQGVASVPFIWPAGTAPGTTLFSQYWVSDPAASFGLSASNGLMAVSN